MKQNKISKLIEFLKDAKLEAKSISWATRKDTVSTTYAVIISVLLIGFYLGVVDIGLSKLIENIIK